VKIRIDPDPVPFSGRPILDVPSCRDSVLARGNTWFYDQYITTETGVPIVLEESENFFDGRFVSRIQEKISIKGNSGYIKHSRWCSGYPYFHYAQTRFKGKDDYGVPIVINGPWVRLMGR
jgi:hypothetical protein